jgi:hypothetical protein
MSRKDVLSWMKGKFETTKRLLLTTDWVFDVRRLQTKAKGSSDAVTSVRAAFTMRTVANNYI